VGKLSLTVVLGLQARVAELETHIDVLQTRVTRLLQQNAETESRLECMSRVLKLKEEELMRLRRVVNPVRPLSLPPLSLSLCECVCVSLSLSPSLCLYTPPGLTLARFCVHVCSCGVVDVLALCVWTHDFAN
jgi:hypothetical protein